MPKLMLLSIVFMTVAVPIRHCARPSPRRALRRVQWTMVAFIVVWALVCITVYPRLVPLE